MPYFVSQALAEASVRHHRRIAFMSQLESPKRSRRAADPALPRLGEHSATVVTTPPKCAKNTKFMFSTGVAKKPPPMVFEEEGTGDRPAETTFDEEGKEAAMQVGYPITPSVSPDQEKGSGITPEKVGDTTPAASPNQEKETGLGITAEKVDEVVQDGLSDWRAGAHGGSEDLEPPPPLPAPVMEGVVDAGSPASVGNELICRVPGGLMIVQQEVERGPRMPGHPPRRVLVKRRRPGNQGRGRQGLCCGRLVKLLRRQFRQPLAQTHHAWKTPCM